MNKRPISMLVLLIDFPTGSDRSGRDPPRLEIFDRAIDLLFATAPEVISGGGWTTGLSLERDQTTLPSSVTASSIHPKCGSDRVAVGNRSPTLTRTFAPVGGRRRAFTGQVMASA